MNKSIVIHKKQGETPLEALNAFKRAHSEYKDAVACYAGRLDPMAEGKLLLLFGEECKKKDRYAALDKEYEVEVLLDVGSDTGDALGLVSYSGHETRVDPGVLDAALRAERGAHMREYPAFSSKTVNGKQLFLYALEGKLGDIIIPKHEERVYAITHVGSAMADTAALRVRINAFLAKVPLTDEPSKALGENFRIDAVRKSWDALFTAAGERSFATLRLRVACGSGTYMRTLAGRLGEALGTKALALSITRTKIGKRWLGFWLEPGQSMG